jgi:hypothetical protein
VWNYYNGEINCENVKEKGRKRKIKGDIEVTRIK